MREIGGAATVLRPEQSEPCRGRREFVAESIEFFDAERRRRPIEPQCPIGLGAVQTARATQVAGVGRIHLQLRRARRQHRVAIPEVVVQSEGIGSLKCDQLAEGIRPCSGYRSRRQRKASR